MFKKNIEWLKNKNLTLVFLIPSPLTALVSRLIIDEFELNKSEILLVSYRNTPLNLFNYPSIEIKQNKIAFYIQKLFFYSISSNIVLNNVKKEFVLFTSSATKDANSLINSKKCLGHFYIEEGQGSYFDHKPFNYNGMTAIQFIKSNFSNKFIKIDNYINFYRDDSLGFIGINKNCYPMIAIEDKFYLNNLERIKKYYNPKIFGIKRIALSCAESRLINNNWEEMILKLIKYLPGGGLIKLHPSFYTSNNKIKKINSFLIEQNFKNISLCKSDVILELEMIYEKKIFYGPKTTLSYYAEMLGSEFKHIELY